jgi:acyl carrier protein phosphodiesterase
MNWLCHVALLQPAPLREAGAILADDLKGQARAGLPSACLEGMTHHEAVDRFTDAHPAVLRSKARVPPPFRRYAGILVDVFYGRLLAASWGAERCAGYLEGLHTRLIEAAVQLPPWPDGFLTRLVRDEWIADYARPDGHHRVLGRLDRRLAQRFGRRVRLGEGARLLDETPSDFTADFAAFHPALVTALGERSDS